MSNYAYCSVAGCDSPLARPTLNELRWNEWECNNGHNNKFHSNRLDLLIEYVEEIQELLDKVSQHV